MENPNKQEVQVKQPKNSNEKMIHSKMQGRIWNIYRLLYSSKQIGFKGDLEKDKNVSFFACCTLAKFCGISFAKKICCKYITCPLTIIVS